MLITKHFVFLHLQKTGGSFIKGVCEKYLPSDWLVRRTAGPHLPYKHLPAEAAELPVFALVRNPWDWYVSWYHFAQEHIKTPQGQDNHPDSVMLWVGSGRYDFKSSTRIACTGIPGSPSPPIWMRRLQKADVDLYSRWYWICMGRAAEANAVEVGRFENLREDFISFLSRHDVPVDDSFINRVRDNPPSNTSSHEAYQDYYDDDLRELVEHKARYLISRYGYRF